VEYHPSTSGGGPSSARISSMVIGFILMVPCYEIVNR
jgi:hypothetical protein